MRRLLAIFLPCLLLAPVLGQAAIVSDVASTKHNFSATVLPPASTGRTASATSESQICAFCHTPHGATDTPQAPLWNRAVNDSPGGANATYTMYSSTSLDGAMGSEPSGKSKLCLSCHDGTLALGSVNVLNRVENPTIAMTGTEADGTITAGPYGADTGFTRRIGTDLGNDHPISMTYDSSRASNDGELYDPAAEGHVGGRVAGGPPALPQGDYLPLDDNKVECVSCHDPHVRSDVAGENIKFLRVNRFQQQPPVDNNQFDEQSDIICLGCHNKEGWVESAHADPASANERYNGPAAALREFPANMQVWQAACLNCHDPHTVQGSRRILREGTDGLVGFTADGARFKQGGNPAVEEVCWACHSADGNVLQGQVSPNTNPGFEVPDIKTDFTTMSSYMPIKTADQGNGGLASEADAHNIGTLESGALATQPENLARGQDFLEDSANFALDKRHAECTDCHNPHRVMKNRLLNGMGSSEAGTHQHEDGVQHNNIASGVLRGIWGVEPVYTSNVFGDNPTSFIVKRGDPGNTPVSPTGSPNDVDFLSREYQLCFKCHSNFAYGDTPPDLGNYPGSTPAGTNAMTRYTNQAMEYNSPDDHKGEGTSGTPSGAFSGTDAGLNSVDYATNNHRSWHPVMKATGRTAAVRGADENDWRSPFNTPGALGNQTMYCTDCHGSSTASDTTVPDGGENGSPWGPHGSNDAFLLKGPWNKNTGRDPANAAPENGLCFRCHEYDQYGRAIPVPYSASNVQNSGFKTNAAFPAIPFATVNLHVGHSSLLQATFNKPFLCSFCHVAVPHGWKNKVFLANLNDVGLEAGMAPGTQVRYNGFPDSGIGRYFKGPYYNGAALKVKNFARSGEWAPSDCGSAGTPGNGTTGQSWMAGGDEACTLSP